MANNTIMADKISYKSLNLPGFSFKEKQEFKKLTDLGLVDLWRAQNPYEKQYTWWSNAGNCRKLNRGGAIGLHSCSRVFD